MFLAEFYDIATKYFTLQTPAILFPAITLLMLAYTNRFIAINTVIRKLHEDMVNDEKNHDFYYEQIKSFDERIQLVVLSQKAGTLSILACVLSMIVFFFDLHISLYFFTGSLIFMSFSLLAVFREVTLSRDASGHILEDCRRIDKERRGERNK